MSVASAEAAVVTLLEGVVSPIKLKENITIFRGPPRSSAAHPAKSVWCAVASGENARLLGPSDYQRAQVRVRVRSTRDDYAGGYALAAACWTACHAKSPSGFAGSHLDEPEPRYVGQVGDLHQWELVVTLVRVG